MNRGGKSWPIFYTAAVKPESDKEGSVSRETRKLANNEMNFYSLLSDAEFPKNLVQNVIDIHPAKQAAQ